MKTLYLTISRQWFDMIVAGLKKEEYREKKPYWENRLCYFVFNEGYDFKKFDRIHFTNGPYSYIQGQTKGKELPYAILECTGIEIKEPNPEWVPEGTEGYFFAIGLGDLIETNYKEAQQ